MQRIMLDQAIQAFDNGVPVLAVSQGTAYAEWLENTGARPFYELVNEFEFNYGDVPAFFVDDHA